MKNVKFGELDPLKMHNCNVCQNHHYDVWLGYYCNINREYIKSDELNRENDCKDWKTPFENDFKRIDLKRKNRPGR